MKKNEVSAIALVLAMALFQVWWHWRISTGTSWFSEFYRYFDPVTSKGHAGWFDTLIPSILLGLALGYLGWSWSITRHVCYVVSVSFSVVALVPVYSTFFPDLYLYGVTDGVSVGGYIYMYFGSLTTMAVFDHGGRGLGQYMHQSGTN